MRRANLNLRPIDGGAIRRVWLGDRYAWESFDQEGNRLPMLARTMKQAVEKVQQKTADCLSTKPVRTGIERRRP